MSLPEESAIDRLDKIIKKARVDMYKPIQVAEVLRHSRREKSIDYTDIESYKNRSCHWRNSVTQRILGKVSTSSAQFQHNIWNENAFPPEVMMALDDKNKKSDGGVEEYIYQKVVERLGTVNSLIGYIEDSEPDGFQLQELLGFFKREAGLGRSIDKAYEIITHALFETIVTSLEATATIEVPESSRELVSEFEELVKVLLGIGEGELRFSIPAHIYRVGVTNAADRGLDMWANFGPAVQVKHITLNKKVANGIIDQVESDYVVVVCRDADRDVIEIITSQIGWGKRVRGVVTESNLLEWYERCLGGRFAEKLSSALLANLLEGFHAEFPQARAIGGFMKEREYAIE